MRRIVNFRAPLFVAIGLILGIFSFYEFLFGDFWFILVTLVCFFAIGVLLFILKSKTWKGLIAVIVAVLVGFFLSQLNYYFLTKNEVVDRNVLITGRVCDINRNGSDGFTYYLEDCIDDNGVKYEGRVRTYIFDGTFQTGDVLTIRGTVYSTYPIKNSPESYYLRQNVRYEMDTDIVVARSDGYKKLDEVIRGGIFDIAEKYAPNNGDVLYALLTGDRGALSSEKETSFKMAGIIHLLAVSGLHVGFVVAILGFVLKRFKLYPLFECGILLAPLIFYAYICNFTPSVIRAIVMVVCSYLARAAFGRYDLLTSLSFAAIVILLISPFNLFDVGFQLSALSVYGIATLNLMLSRLISKCKLPKVILYTVNSLAISLSCSFSTFFTLQLNYGYAPLLGILLNIVVIPLITVVFVLGWISLLPWIFHYVLYLADWLLEAVGIMSKWVAHLSFSTTAVSAIAITTVVVVVWLFVISGFVNLGKLGKIITNSVLAALLVLCVGLSYVKIPPSTQVYVAYGYDSSISVITSSNGNAVIVGDFEDAKAYEKAIKYISKYKVSNCVLYITNYGECNSVILDDVLRQLSVNSVYKLDFSYNASADSVFVKYDVNIYQQMENTSTGEDIVITSVYDGGLRAVIMQSDGIVITSVYGDVFAVKNYLNLGLYSDAYILPRANKAYSDGSLTTLSQYQSELPFNYGANKYGNFTITKKDDTIIIKFR